MNYQMISKVLGKRYQVVQTLSAGISGQTYIAVDTFDREKTQCVIKQLLVNNYHARYFEHLRLCFLAETETLKGLGYHDQIPRLITCFVENGNFYLVQELIQGHPLTVELPMSQYHGGKWSESKVVEFLQDILGILEFVHSQGFIHCDIKPENIIRRAGDGRLCLIDFGSIQPIDFSYDAELSVDQIPVTSLGYVPPEQFIGHTKPNSDIYALGIIAIQCITGLAPLQLRIDTRTKEIMWRAEDTPINDYLAAVLSRMIRYNFQDRFQCASEVLPVLQQIVWEDQPQNQVPRETREDNVQQHPKERKSSPVLTGLKLGLTINSLLVGWGSYSFFTNRPIYSEAETLYQAKNEYQAGDLPGAIALAQSIPYHSNVYPEAQAAIGGWKQEWQVAAERYFIAEQAFREHRWSEVLAVTPKFPKILYWQSKINKLVQQARANLEAQAQTLLAKAYDRAEVKDFSTALEFLRQIPPESTVGAIVQEKLAEYAQKQQIRARYFLYKAYTKALASDFDSAIFILQRIPQNTAVYTQAQIKLHEYRQKQLMTHHQLKSRIRGLDSSVWS
jgi:serine/threonine protein kinase